MAQSAVVARKTPLNIDVVWENATITSPLSWEKWTQQMKLALLAKEGIQLRILLKRPPSRVVNPREPVYEELVKDHTQATERDRKIQNRQLIVTCQNRCKKIDEIGFICGAKLWISVTKKLDHSSTLALGQTVAVSSNVITHIFFEKEPMKELWKVKEDSFIKPHKITYNRFVFSPENNRERNLSGVSFEDL